MKKMHGKDNFDKRYDYFKWSAPIYENPKEIAKAIMNSGCIGKKLSGINIIGFTRSLDINLYGKLYNLLSEAGFELKDGWFDEYDDEKKTERRSLVKYVSVSLFSLYLRME